VHIVLYENAQTIDMWIRVDLFHTEELCLLGHNTVQSAARACYLLHADFLLVSFFDPEDAGDMFL
jgi:hypothetical protein